MMPTPHAERRDIPSHPGYQADAQGVIWSSRGPKDPAGNVVWRRLGPVWHRKGGRLQVVLHCGGGRIYSAKVGTLVLSAFVGPKPLGMECCHGPNGARDNRPENLRWDSHLENMRDKDRHGTLPRGEAVGTAKLTEADVRAIRRLCAAGMTQAEVARRYKVAPCTVHCVVSRKSWRHVP